jgi:hypothetical protein
MVVVVEHGEGMVGAGLQGQQTAENQAIQPGPGLEQRHSIFIHGASPVKIIGRSGIFLQSRINHVFLIGNNAQPWIIDNRSGGFDNRGSYQNRE